MNTHASMTAPAFVPLVTEPRLRLAVFLLLMVVLFMATLDNQIVSTALPTIVGEFGQLERFGWVGSSYLLASSAVMPLYGKLGDLFGRKYVMMSAVAIFVVGSAVCGLAVSMNTLIAARVLQGLGGGGLMVSIFSVSADLFAPRERARYQSYLSLVLMASGAIGPTLGGAMSEAFGWRSIFLVNVPIGLIAFGGLFWLLPHRAPHRRPVIDYTGALLLAVTMTTLVLATDGTELTGSLISAANLAVIGVGICSALAWVMVERRAIEPIIPLSLLRNPTISLLLIVSLASGSIGIGLVNYYALFLQTTTGLSPSAAGLLFIALTGGIVTGSMSGGRLISMTGRYKPFAIMSISTSLIALFLFSRIQPGVSVVWIVAIMALQGIGVGLGQQVPVLGVQNATPQKDIGAATGAVTLTRMSGAAIAISIYGAVIASSLDTVGTAIPGVENIEKLTPLMLASLPETARQAVAASYTAAFQPLFFTAIGIAAIGLIAAISLKPVRLPAAAQPRDR